MEEKLELGRAIWELPEMGTWLGCVAETLHDDS